MRRHGHAVIMLSIIIAVLSVSCSRDSCLIISDPLFHQVVLSEGLRDEIADSGISCRYQEYQKDSDNLWLDRKDDDRITVLSPAVSREFLDGSDPRLTEYVEQQQSSGRVICLESQGRISRLEGVRRFDGICFIQGDLGPGWVQAVEQYQDRNVGIIAFSTDEAQSTVPGMFPLDEQQALYTMDAKRVSRGEAQQALSYMEARQVEILFVLLGPESLEILSEMGEYDMLAVIEHGRYAGSYQDVVSGSVEYDYPTMLSEVIREDEGPCTASLEGTFIMYEHDNTRR